MFLSRSGGFLSFYKYQFTRDIQELENKNEVEIVLLSSESNATTTAMRSKLQGLEPEINWWMLVCVCFMLQKDQAIWAERAPLFSRE